MPKLLKQIGLSSLRKHTRIKSHIVILLLLLINSSFSQNLIQNMSFESYTSINCTNGNILGLNNWTELASPDYFHSSCTFGYKVPENYFGISYPVNGNAYIGLLTFLSPDANSYREYIYQNLNSPLITGKSYYLSFYVSLCDGSHYAVKNIGAYLSISQPVVATNSFMNVNPQVENQNGFISDTTGWTKIEGYFIAQGGEQYITIGNFNSNANTDTLYTGTLSPFSNAKDSYYFIDDVSLYDSISNATRLSEIGKTEAITLYPNPNNGEFNLEYKITKASEFVLTDITGQLIYQRSLLPPQNILLIKQIELKAGVYFYYIMQRDKIIKQNKIIIIK